MPAEASQRMADPRSTGVGHGGAALSCPKQGAEKVCESGLCILKEERVAADNEGARLGHKTDT